MTSAAQKAEPSIQSYLRGSGAAPFSWASLAAETRKAASAAAAQRAELPSAAAAQRDEHVFAAKLAEQAERYGEMLASMHRVVDAVADNGPALTLEERNLFSAAVRNVVGAKRASLRVLDSAVMEEDEAAADSASGSAAHVVATERAERCREYIGRVTLELEETCNDAVQMCETLLASAEGGEETVFFMRMRADLLRYLAERGDADQRDALRATAEAAYLDAICEIEVSFAPTHPMRLAMGLSRAVQLYEVEGNLAAACALAQSTIDAAETEIDQLHRDEDAYEDSQHVLQLLRDNLATWTRALPVGVALGLVLHRYDSNRS